MKVILTADVAKLGKSGEMKDVADGYRPQLPDPAKLAVPAAGGAYRAWQHDIASREDKRQREREEAEIAATRIGGTTLTMGVKVGDGGKLYGSITAKDIADALGRRGITVDRHKIDLEEPLKSLGTYKVAIKVFAGHDARSHGRRRAQGLIARSRSGGRPIGRAGASSPGDRRGRSCTSTSTRSSRRSSSATGPSCAASRSSSGWRRRSTRRRERGVVRGPQVRRPLGDAAADRRRALPGRDLRAGRRARSTRRQPRGHGDPAAVHAARASRSRSTRRSSTSPGRGRCSATARRSPGRSGRDPRRGPADRLGRRRGHQARRQDRARDLRKPDGLVVVEPGTEAAFLAPLPISRLWGVGDRRPRRRCATSASPRSATSRR